MKFVKLLFVFISTILVVSCSSLKAPEYIGISNVEISKVINDSITLSAGINFKNPNRVGGKMTLENLHAVINDVELGNLTSQSIDVPAKNNFSVPLEIKLSYKQILDSKKGLLSTLLSSVLTNSVRVKFSGNATFTKFLLKKEYPILYNEKIKIIK